MRAEPGTGGSGARRAEVVDVAALPAGSSDGPVVLWSASNQLQANIVRLPPDLRIASHVEALLDVTLTVLTGALTLGLGAEGDAEEVVVTAPAVVVLPAGTRRRLTAGPVGTTYLTAHQRRGGLLPGAR